MFIEKMNCIRICKREDCVPDPIRTQSQVKSGTGALAPHKTLKTTFPFLGAYYTNFSSKLKY